MPPSLLVPLHVLHIHLEKGFTSRPSLQNLSGALLLVGCNFLIPPGPGPEHPPVQVWSGRAPAAGSGQGAVPGEGAAPTPASQRRESPGSLPGLRASPPTGVAGCGSPTAGPEELGEGEGCESSQRGWGVSLGVPRSPRGFLLAPGLDSLALRIGTSQHRVWRCWGCAGRRCPGVGEQTSAGPRSAPWGRTLCVRIVLGVCQC